MFSYKEMEKSFINKGCEFYEDSPNDCIDHKDSMYQMFKIVYKDNIAYGIYSIKNKSIIFMSNSHYDTEKYFLKTIF